MELGNILVWPAIIAVPLFFTLGCDRFEHLFPREWYDMSPMNYYESGTTPRFLGCSLGILAVIVGQVSTLVFFYFRRDSRLGKLTSIQKQGARKYDLQQALKTHLFQLEGFVLLGGYLIITWMTGWMPQSYYSFEGGISWLHVFAQLLIVDFLQSIMHYGEHAVHPYIYQISHKPHHFFTNPRLFDAFDGSLMDTICMILVPLFVCARIVPANVWSYMTFGTLYANWLCLIHSEYHHVWDGLFYQIGFGTPADHHVHHKVFIYNYGHLFM